MNKKIVLELAVDDDKFLMQDIATLTLFHGKNIRGKSIVFSNSLLRELNEQYPLQVETKSVSVGEDGYLSCDNLRRLIRESPNDTLLACRNSNGELAGNIYLGKQFGDDPFTRIIYTDKVSEDIYCASGKIGLEELDG